MSQETNRPTIVRSVSSSQQEILENIATLHCGGEFECDATYGNGAFWKGKLRPRLAFDIEPLSDAVARADSRSLPVTDGALGSVVFDPPFLTYVRGCRSGNGSMVMAKRFAGYWRYNELQEHYASSMREFHRVLKDGGRLVFKCQDIIHNHRMHATHVWVINEAASIGFRLVDIFVLAANHRMPSPNRAGKQKHARIFHSYFLVMEKTKGKDSNAKHGTVGAQVEAGGVAERQAA